MKPHLERCEANLPLELGLLDAVVRLLLRSHGRLRPVGGVKAHGDEHAGGGTAAVGVARGARGLRGGRRRCHQGGLGGPEEWEESH